MTAVVTDGRTLRALAKAGYIVWTPGRTERHWTGCTVPVVNVDEGPRLKHWSDTFTHRDKAYRLRYIDGCFKPFVCHADMTPPSFV